MLPTSFKKRVLLLTVGLTLLLLFALFKYPIVSDCDICDICDCEYNNNQEIHPISKRELRLQHFPEYLEANEKIRQRFLKKRKNEILAGRSANGEHRKGWRYVWDSFVPVFTCPHLVERIGTAEDGGKWICGLDIYENRVESAPCVIYSLGVGGDSSFEVEMVKRTPCSVYAYDYTVNKMQLPPGLESQYKDRIKFFKLGLGSKEKAKNNPIFRTLGQLMKENGHDWIDFLKVDIEGAEFALLTEMNEEFEKIPYGHLNVEIHLNEKAILGDEILQRQEFMKLFNFWKSLENKGLRAWWWEQNFYYLGTFGKGPPVLMEYAFINIRDVARNKLIQF